MVHLEVTTGEFCDIPWEKFTLNLNLNFQQRFSPCKRRWQEWDVENALDRGNKTFKWERTWQHKKCES